MKLTFVHIFFFPNQVENFYGPPSKFKFLSKFVCARNTREGFCDARDRRRRQSVLNVLVYKKQNSPVAWQAKGHNQE